MTSCGMQLPPLNQIPRWRLTVCMVVAALLILSAVLATKGLRSAILMTGVMAVLLGYNIFMAIKAPGKTDA